MDVSNLNNGYKHSLKNVYDNAKYIVLLYIADCQAARDQGSSGWPSWPVASPTSCGYNENWVRIAYLYRKLPWILS